MPIFFAAIIGFVRFVIGQGRKLFWVKGFLLYSMSYEKREPLNTGELCYFLAKKIYFWHVRNPLPRVPCMVGENLKVRDCPLASSFSRLVGGRASHSVLRPQ